jgi:predicted DNA-binding transcriptional regulator AlpA
MNMIGDTVDLDPTGLRARLRANPVRPPLDHLKDLAALWRQIGGGDVPILDSDDNEEPVEPVRRKHRPPLASVARPMALPPRLICREDAAAYVSVSPNTFDAMVADGRMPDPRRLTERRLAWDVRQLDAAIDRLPVDGDAETASDTTDHSWKDIDAQAKAKSAVR